MGKSMVLGLLPLVLLGMVACGEADEGVSTVGVDAQLVVTTEDAPVGGFVEFSIDLQGSFHIDDPVVVATFLATNSNPDVLGSFELVGRTPAESVAPTNNGSGANESWQISVPNLDANIMDIRYDFRARCLAEGTSTVSSSVGWRIDLNEKIGSDTTAFDDRTFACTAAGGEINVGDRATIAGPEGAVYFDPAHFTAGSYELSPHVAVCGSGGYQVHELDGGTSVDSGEGTYYGAVVANESIVSYGSGGYFLQNYDAKTSAFGPFGQLGAFTSNITGASVVASAAAAGVLSILLADNTTDQVLKLSPIESEFGSTFQEEESPVLNFAEHLSGIPGNVVGIYSPPGDGAIVGVSEEVGVAGHVFWVNLNNPSGITNVGTVGQGPRRITCLEPEGTPCVVSSFTAGQVTVLDWGDRNAAPTIRANPVSVDGPIGCDMARVNNVPTALCTGFNDDSLHFISIDGKSVTDSSSVLTGCDGPGHAIYLSDGHTLVTCNLSNNFQVAETPSAS